MENNYHEIDDQAGFLGCMFAMHLRDAPNHNGKPQEDCAFCKGFILSASDLRTSYPLESYKFLIIDVSEDGNESI